MARDYSSLLQLNQLKSMNEIRLGCSGWDKRDWEGTFYSDKEESKLSAYSKVFNTAEINSTFYSYPAEGLVYGWARYTPPDFKFTVKINRLITHEKQLSLEKDVKTDVERFCALLKPLSDAGKLACILIQLPPGMEFDAGKLEAFLGILPGDFRYALEFRNNTWVTGGIEARKIMKRHNVAQVIVDGPLLPVETSLTSDFAYTRWHGRGKKIWYNYRYTEEELAAWALRIKEISRQVEVFGYFSNHYHAFAPENCIELLEMLGIATPQQTQAKMRIERTRQVTKNIVKTVTLDEFFHGEPIETLLLSCMDKVRFEKAKQVKDIEILDSGKDIILADVRGYSIYIDTGRKFVLHDCPDWRWIIREKKFCKHLGGLVLALPEEYAREILRLAKNGEFEYRSYTG